jgi:hypothetical protein
MKIVIWVGSLFVCGLVGTLTTWIIVLPFAYFADKKKVD